MDYLRITHDNIATEHICCAISNERDAQVVAKKNWLSARFDEGLVFLRANVRGKFFIEYLPAEAAWAPIDAPGYLYINCFWISGQYKGHGYANDLLDACIRDGREKGKRGLCVLSSTGKKLPFLSDPAYLAHKGFLTADTLAPHFSLLYLPFTPDAPIPHFRDCARHPTVQGEGFTLYYADQCPYTAKYVPLLIAAAEEQNVPLRAVHLQSTEEAQNAPTPFTSFSLFRDGTFLTHEMMTPQKFRTMF